MDNLARVEQLRDLSDRQWSDPWRARQALASASGMVRAYCGWWIAPVQQFTAVLSGDGSTVLGLPCTRVVDVVEVAVDGSSVAPLTGYRWSPNGLVVRRGGVWPDDLANVTVRFVGGYDAVPDEVVAVVCALADTLDTPTGVAAQSIDDESVTYARGADDATGLTTRMRETLDRGFVVPPRA